ncbi:adenylyltransferase/cytidyltransferase family protein [bacterium]|nr:adenylyltransferase/cytidyltransferase family protein [bacterium]
MRRRTSHAWRALPRPRAGLSVGVIGGSFDPPHAGHSHLIETAMRRLGLDAVWVIPARGNPLKRTGTPFDVRLGAARSLFQSRRIKVSAFEAAAGLTYTADLIDHLQMLAPDARFVWIMGGDNLGQFHRWRRWRDIARSVPICVISRPGASPRAGLSKFARVFAAARVRPFAARRLARKQAPAWTYLTAPLNAESSTRLRAMTGQG